MADKKIVLGVNIPTNAVTIILDNSNNDKAAFEKDDIVPEVMKEIIEYSATRIKEDGNYPYITNETNTVSLTRDGIPTPLTDSGANTTYTEILKDEGGDDGSKAINEFKTISNSNLLDINFSKGKVSDKSIPSAESLIREVSEKLGNSKISVAAEKLLSENSRYSKSDPYVQDVKEENSHVGEIHLNNKIGQYSPKKFPTVNSDDVKYEIKQLKDLGIQLLFKASGEIYTPKDTQDVGEITKARAAALVPGQARLGLKIPMSRFSPSEIVADINPNFKKQSNFPELNGQESYSHGSFYNPLIPFDSIGSDTFTKPAAILLTLTFEALLKGLARALGPSPIPSVPTSLSQLGSLLDQSNNSTAQSNAEKRKHRLGNYLGQKPAIDNPNSLTSAFNSNFLGLTVTRAPYADAVDKGVSIFFGKSALGGGAVGGLVGTLAATVGIGDTFKNVSHNPAYFNVLLRFLVKTLVSTMGGLASTLGAIPGVDQFLNNVGFTQLDVEKNIGLEQDPTNIINMVGILRSAPIIRFMDILARLGDIYIEHDSFRGEAEFFDYIDSIPDTVADNQPYPNPAALIKKNRLSDKLASTRYNDSLAWGADTLRSLYIIPEQFIKANSDFGADGNSLTMIQADKNFSPISNANRLTREQVKTLELELEGYYMPFYFHDLRTNEIISFHAFIENITDSFDTEYVQSEGFGRIGKVYQYKNTNRKIGLSFKFVSVNKQDFSSMWFKINKLAMMMYPQYTEGRQLGVSTPAGQQKFIQPFSQLIASTPVIRLRVGDLIKSNYSDIDLARLFGIGTDKFGIGSTQTTTPTINSTKSITQVITDNHIAYKFSVDDTTYLDGSALNSVNVNKSVIIGVPYLPDTKIKAKIKKISGPFVYDIQVIEPSNFANEKITINFGGLGPGLSEPDINCIISKVGNPIETPTDAESSNSFGANEQIRQFFDPTGDDGNPIVKSFDSVRGEGLAGVLTSMNFDWSEARWDTSVGFNSKAPIMGKVDLSFEVIHDINPGLDSSGMMIGAPYNIGQLMKHLKVNRDQKLKLANEDAVTNNVAKTTVKPKA